LDLFETERGSLYQARVLWAGLPYAALQLLELYGERVEFSFGGGSVEIRVLATEQSRLQLRFGGNEPAEFAFTDEQGGIDPIADLHAGLVEHLEQGARAAAFARQQGGRAKSPVRLLGMEANQHFDLEFLHVAYGGGERGAQRGAHYFRANRFRCGQGLARAIRRRP